MLKVRIAVVATPEDVRTIYDYLLSTDKMIYKLKHFCESIALGEQYKKGLLNFGDCIGRSGQVRIGIQPGKAKEGGGFWPDKNTVEDYEVIETFAEPFNDEIKF